MHVRRPQVRPETYRFELFHIENSCNCEIKPETVLRFFFIWKQISGASLQNLACATAQTQLGTSNLTRTESSQGIKRNQKYKKRVYI